jgi:hypothetical protein
MRLEPPLSRPRVAMAAAMRCVRHTWRSPWRQIGQSSCALARVLAMRTDPTPRPAIYQAYWSFAEERHRIFERRFAGDAHPWTNDPVMLEHRFCNVFRAADRVSQHLIGEAAYGDPDADADDLFLRIVLHRLFCRPSTWDLLCEQLGPIEASAFSADDYVGVLDEAFESGRRLYTGAYILCANRAFGHERKHRNHIALIAAMLDGGVPGRIADASTLKDVYEELRTWPLLGPFMAYQLAIDLNYSPLLAFSENEFTVPGPGAMRGLSKIFIDLGAYSPAGAISWLVEQQGDIHDQMGIDPPRLFGRPLHAIDCQNLLCEVDKYCRVAFPELLSDRRRIKQRFVPDPEPMDLYFPPDWGINEAIPSDRRRDVHHPAHI